MAIIFDSLNKMGRLGNTAFQIASTIGIAIKNNTNYSFPEWKYQSGFKNHLPNLRLTEWEIVKEKSFSYDEYNLSILKNWNLFGYFQSFKYWEHCKPEVLKYFEFKESLSVRMRNNYADILSEKPIAIHIRRGDYLGLQKYHPVLPLEYYNKALSHFPKEKKCIIFSDDIEWCKKHFLTDKFVFATGSEVEDLCLMTMCSGHIIANSSFSFWGAYLSDSDKIIAPLNWFGEKISHSTKDLIPENWLRI